MHEKSFKYPHHQRQPTHQAASVEDESTLLLLWKYLRAWINDSRRFSRKHMHKEREKLFIIGTNTIESKVVKKSPLGCKRQSGNAQVETAPVDGVRCAVVSARWSRSRVNSLLSTAVLDFFMRRKQLIRCGKFSIEFLSWFLITQEMKFCIIQLVQFFLKTMKKSLNYLKIENWAFSSCFIRSWFSLSLRKTSNFIRNQCWCRQHTESFIVKAFMWFRKRTRCSKENPPARSPLTELRLQKHRNFIYIRCH